MGQICLLYRCPSTFDDILHACQDHIPILCRMAGVFWRRVVILRNGQLCPAVFGGQFIAHSLIVFGSIRQARQGAPEGGDQELSRLDLQDFALVSISLTLLDAFVSNGPAHSPIGSHFCAKQILFNHVRFGECLPDLCCGSVDGTGRFCNEWVVHDFEVSWLVWNLFIVGTINHLLRRSRRLVPPLTVAFDNSLTTFYTHRSAWPAV